MAVSDFDYTEELEAELHWAISLLADLLRLEALSDA